MFKTTQIFSVTCLVVCLVSGNSVGAVEGSPAVQKYYDVGKSYLVNQKYDMAIREFNGALSLSPKNVDVLIERGTAYNGLGKYDLALKDFDKAISLNPSSYLGFNNRGVTFLRKGEYARATQDFDKALSLDSKQPIAYLNRAGASLCAGTGADSAQKIEAWLKRNGWKDAYAGHAAILAAFGYRQGKNPKAAQALVEEALKRTDKLKWPYPALRFLSGGLNGKEVLEKAEESDYETTQAHCFIALDCILKKERKKADIHLLWAGQHGTQNSVEYWIARGLSNSK